MAYCSECGFYLDGDECDMCESAMLRLEREHAAAQEWEENGDSTRRPLSTWWRAVAATPLLLCGSFLFARQTGTFPWLPYWLTIAIYSTAVLLDIRYVNQCTTGWRPKKLVWVGLLGMNFVTAGALTFLLTPYYVYKRLGVTNADSPQN